MFSFQRSSTPEISVDELDALLAVGGTILIDVREDAEVRRGHVRGALHVSLSQLHGRMEQLPRDRRIAVICQSGNRSRTGTDMLVRAGFTDAVSVAGGTSAWIRSGRTVMEGAARAA